MTAKWVMATAVEEVMPGANRGVKVTRRNASFTAPPTCLDGSEFGYLRFHRESASTKKCPLILLLPRRPMFLISGQASPLDAGSASRCIDDASGYRMAYNAAVRAQSTADAMRFLQRNLQP